MIVCFVWVYTVDDPIIRNTIIWISLYSRMLKELPKEVETYHQTVIKPIPDDVKKEKTAELCLSHFVFAGKIHFLLSQSYK